MILFHMNQQLYPHGIQISNMKLCQKNGKEATIDVEVLKCKETNLNMGKKEKKCNLLDLDFLSIELETLHPYIVPMSLDMRYTDTVSNNANKIDNP